MPRLVEWSRTLTDEGHPVQLTLMSTDTEPGAMRKFYKKNEDFPESALMADGSGAAAWITELGMEGAALPVHVWLDREHRIRCMRAGALGKDNLREVRALVSQ
jgi:predicted transcriptional regulator